MSRRAIISSDGTVRRRIFTSFLFHFIVCTVISGNPILHVQQATLAFHEHCPKHTSIIPSLICRNREYRYQTNWNSVTVRGVWTVGNSLHMIVKPTAGNNSRLSICKSLHILGAPFPCICLLNSPLLKLIKISNTIIYCFFKYSGKKFL